MRPGEYRYEMQGGQYLVVTVSVRTDRLDVYIDTTERKPSHQIRLFISFTDSTIFIQDLYGNNKGGHLHRQGLGALAVNTAIQCLRTLCPDNAWVRGHVYDAQDTSIEAQNARVAFWREFNFEVTDPNAKGDQYIGGTLGALRYVTDGKVMGEHPRMFDISLMTKTA